MVFSFAFYFYWHPVACIKAQKIKLRKVPFKGFFGARKDSSRASLKLEFSEDFSGVDVGAEPENIFILDGEYTVQKEEDNKCLTLPGTPMGDFGLLFGPREREKPLELNFAFFATKKGRRMPSIAASIGGVRGYRLRLNPRLEI